MTRLHILRSKEDASVNFVDQRERGIFESRYVRRCDDYFVAYLSSQTGCNRGCAMCHLTATDQTSFIHSDVDDFRKQAEQVCGEYAESVDKGAPEARYMHYAFMARGEPLANRSILNKSREVLNALGEVAEQMTGLPAKFCVSTIVPKTLTQSLIQVFPYVTPTVYYSLYSMQPEFRAKWLPGAMDPHTALDMLVAYQRFTKKTIKIHHALIAGENDSEGDAYHICDALNWRQLRCEFNIVRYNPASAEQGREASESDIDAYVGVVKAHGFPIKVVSRVGHDVKASCGMFVGGTNYVAV
jgi:adenine C2-methylase RlmN of 23S rRNA A2503 and tRNA A37